MLTAEWFEAGLRAELVLDMLTRQVPDLAGGLLTLLRCRITRIRSLPAAAWTATYELDVRDTGTGTERTFAAAGVLTPPGTPLPRSEGDAPFGDDGWSCVLPDLRLHLQAVPFDASLPGLAIITDPVRGPALLEESLHACGALPADVAVARCVPTVAAHKPGVRATVICRLDYAGDVLDAPAAPGAVVVKVHHDDEGERSYEAMRALSASALASSPVVRLARPLVYLPDERMAIQEYVEHQLSLKDLFHRAFEDGTAVAWTDLIAATRATAAGLADLHQCGTSYGDPVTWDDELATLRKKHDKLVAVMPTLRKRTGSALERVAAAAATTPADPLGPAHHSFRPAQVLLNHGRVSFIDFDKFCQAEPASDIAVLLAKRRHMAANKLDGAAEPEAQREAMLDELEATFLDEYRRHAPVSGDRVAVWLALELFSLVLSAAKKMNEAWIDRCSQMLERHLTAYGI